MSQRPPSHAPTCTDDSWLTDA